MVRLLSYRGAGQPLTALGVLIESAPPSQPLAALVLALLQAAERPLTRRELLRQLAAAGRPVPAAGLASCLHRMHERRQLVYRPGPGGGEHPRPYAAGVVQR